MRQVVLDTETTGLEPEHGHRVVEIGAVELVDRRPTGERLQLYVDPEREIDDAAFEIHGLDKARLAGEPKFAAIAERFVNFIAGAEVIIHNAPFDVTFLDYELSLLDGASRRRMADLCVVTDSLALARRKHPGQKNSLDALCRRYQVDNSARELHGALLDAEILADVYLALTGGQLSLFGGDEDAAGATPSEVIRLPDERPPVPVVLATPEELVAHEAYLDNLDSATERGALWRFLPSRFDAPAGSQHPSHADPAGRAHGGGVGERHEHHAPVG